MSGPWEDYAAGPWNDFKPPDATWQDRAQAGKAGLMRTGAWAASAIPDLAANTFNLGRAGIGTAYHEATGNPIPSALQVDSVPSPVYSWLTSQMDKSPVTSTQVNRPDDAVSRYIATGSNALSGGLLGGGGLVRSAASIPAAFAGQIVAEKKPFESDAANNAASIGASALIGALTPRGKGPDIPGRNDQNTAIRSAQEKGMVFPPATTNPTAVNRLVESVAGKQKIQQGFQVKNQGAANAMTREDLGLPPSSGPIQEAEIAQAKANAAPGYNAVRNAGFIRLDNQFKQDADSALSAQTGAARLAASLRDPTIEKIVGEAKGTQAITASDAIDAIAALRDKKKAAYAASETKNGDAYGSLAKALEDAIERSLNRRGQAGADLVNDFKDSRQKFAITYAADEARNPATGNIRANALQTALNKGEPLSGNLRLIAKASGQAPLAFKEPTHSTEVSHTGLLGALLGGAVATHELGLDWGAAPLVAAGAFHGARSAAKWYAGGPLQKDAIPAAQAPFSPSTLAGILASMPANNNR